MGLRRFFRRLLPPHETIRAHRHLQVLGGLLHDPNLFHLTRRSTAGGVAAGLFFAFMPLPGHMIFAAIAAVFFRVNLPIAATLVWITNPLTLPPIFYLAYETGAHLLQRPHPPVHFEFTWHWFGTTFVHIWPPLVLGCLVFAVLAAVSGYAAVRLLWRLAIIRKLAERKIVRRANHVQK